MDTLSICTFGENILGVFIITTGQIRNLRRSNLAEVFDIVIRKVDMLSDSFGGHIHFALYTEI